MKKSLPLFLSLFACLAMYSQQQGTKNPSTSVSDSVSGSINWIHPGNVCDSDGVYATDSIYRAHNRTAYLKATGFGFAIPNNATITGITAAVDGSYPLIVGGQSILPYVKLIKGGVYQKDSLQNTYFSSSDSWVLFGGSDSLWKNTWTYSDINNSGFGMAFSVYVKFISANSLVFSVDVVAITVNYTTPTGIAGSPEQFSQTRSAYPNPSKGPVYISNTGKYMLRVMDNAGKEVYNAELTGPQKIDLSFLSNGIYFLNTNDGTSTFTQKVVLNSGY